MASGSGRRVRPVGPGHFMNEVLRSVLPQPFLRKVRTDPAAVFRCHWLRQARRRKRQARPACVPALPPDIMPAGADRCGRQLQEI